MEPSEIAKILLELDAVILNPKKPFVFASGIKSPIYCDNRLLISHAKERKQVVEAFDQLITDHKIPYDVVAGTATAGIPWASWIADLADKPMIYVRRISKGHGRQNKIEGEIKAGQKAIVVEDLISSGGSSIDTIKTLQDMGVFVTACLAIFTYQMKSAELKFSDLKVPLYTLCNFKELVDYACEHQYMTQDHKTMVLEWAKNPKDWGDQYGV